MLTVAVALALIQLAESASVGTPAKGSLKDGVSFASRGEGFVTYSTIGNAIGRQYVHSRVHQTLVAAFTSLHAAVPDRTFVLGVTGLKSGGRFSPHRTHQNGLSVDIFMPVRDGKLRHAVMPTAPWNKFGYSLEFDRSGRGEGLQVDFDSIAELLLEVHRQAARHGLAVEKIIVAPEYVDRVLSSKAEGIRQMGGLFMRRPAWVRHDEHLHIDFRVLTSRKSK